MVAPQPAESSSKNILSANSPQDDHKFKQNKAEEKIEPIKEKFMTETKKEPLFNRFKNTKKEDLIVQEPIKFSEKSHRNGTEMPNVESFVKQTKTPQQESKRSDQPVNNEEKFKKEIFVEKKENDFKRISEINSNKKMDESRTENRNEDKTGFKTKDPNNKREQYNTHNSSKNERKEEDFKDERDFVTRPKRQTFDNSEKYEFERTSRTNSKPEEAVWKKNKEFEEENQVRSRKTSGVQRNYNDKSGGWYVKKPPLNEASNSHEEDDKFYDLHDDVEFKKKDNPENFQNTNGIVVFPLRGRTP